MNLFVFFNTKFFLFKNHIRQHQNTPPVGEVVFEEGDKENDDYHENHDNHDMITIQVHGSANLGESC